MSSGRCSLTFGPSWFVCVLTFDLGWVCVCGCVCVPGLGVCVCVCVHFRQVCVCVSLDAKLWWSKTERKELPATVLPRGRWWKLDRQAHHHPKPTEAKALQTALSELELGSWTGTWHRDQLTPAVCLLHGAPGAFTSCLDGFPAKVVCNTALTLKSKKAGPHCDRVVSVARAKGGPAPGPLHLHFSVDSAAGPRNHLGNSLSFAMDVCLWLESAWGDTVLKLLVMEQF